MFFKWFCISIHFALMKAHHMMCICVCTQKKKKQNLNKLGKCSPYFLLLVSVNIIYLLYSFHTYTVY